MYLVVSIMINPIFADKETEAQRGGITCLRSHTVVEQRLDPGQCGARAWLALTPPEIASLLDVCIPVSAEPQVDCHPPWSLDPWVPFIFLTINKNHNHSSSKQTS